MNAKVDTGAALAAAAGKKDDKKDEHKAEHKPGDHVVMDTTKGAETPKADNKPAAPAAPAKAAAKKAPAKAPAKDKKDKKEKAPKENKKKIAARKIFDANKDKSAGEIAQLIQKKLEITYANAYYYVTRSFGKKADKPKK